MKKINLILLILLTTFGLNTNVYAITTEGNVVDVQGEEGDSSKKPNRVPYVNDNGTFGGFRISITDSNGNYITHNDYSDSTISRYKTIYATTDNYVKSEYTAGDAVVFEGQYSNQLYNSIDSFEKLLEKYNFDSPDISSKVNSADNVQLGFFNTLFDSNNHIGGDYNEDLLGILSDLGVNLDVHDVNDLNIVVEPTSVFLLEGKPYYGTAHELLNEAAQHPAIDCNSSQAYGNTALCNMGLYGKKNLVCGALLSDTTSAGNKVDQYFGTVDVLEGAADACSNNGFTYSQLLDNNGIGMGVINMSQYIENPPTFDCGVIQQYANDSKKYMCTDTDALARVAAGFLNNPDRPKSYDVYAQQLNANPEIYAAMCGCEPELTCDIIQQYAGVSATYQCDDTASISSAIQQFASNPDRPEAYDSLASSMSTDLYIEYCGCKQKEPVKDYNCEPLKIVSTCSAYAVKYQEGIVGYDVEAFWNGCVDSPGASAATAAEYYEGGLGDRTYCPVYCAEKLDATYDYTIPNVNAGYHFVWPNAERTKVSGSRVCRVQKRILSDGELGHVDWHRFMKDLYNANWSATTSYHQYIFELDRQEKIAGVTVRTNSSNCECIYNTDHNSCCTAEEWVAPTKYDCNVYNYETGEFVWTENGCTSEGYYRCTQTNDEHYDEYYNPEPAKAQTQYIVYDYNKGLIPKSGNLSSSDYISWCSNETKPTANPSGPYSSYLQAISSVYAYIERMTKCSVWDANTVYNLKPYANIIYDDGESYSVDEALGTGKTSDTGLIKLEYECESSSEPKVESCSGTRLSGNCIANSETVTKCKKVKMRRDMAYTHYLPGGIYEYVMKDNNESVHSPSNSVYGFNDYIDIGYSNLPVSYGAKNGAGELAITYGGLGHNSRIDDKLKDEASYGYWSCGFTVYDELIDEKEINVIFRPIDINNPFPDITGDGRITGSNWCAEGNCSNNNATVQEYITDKSDIYSKEPMYVFELNPLTIMQIRSYNKSQELKYADFNLDCETATGNACISEFVSDLISGAYGNTYPSGKCTQSMYRVTKSDVFYKCQN